MYQTDSLARRLELAPIIEFKPRALVIYQPAGSKLHRLRDLRALPVFADRCARQSNHVEQTNRSPRFDRKLFCLIAGVALVFSLVVIGRHIQEIVLAQQAISNITWEAYTVSSGETLWEISRERSVEDVPQEALINSMVKKNKIDQGAGIRAGQVIYVPAYDRSPE